MPTEIDILGHPCDVVKHGSLLKIASIRLPLSVLISRDFAKSLRILLVKLLRNVRLRSQISLGRRQKKTLLLPDAEVDNVPGVTRNLCYLSVLSRMKRAIPWKTKMNLEEDFVSIGEPFSKHAWKARDITSTKIFCDMSNKLLMTSVGLDQAEFDDLLALKKDSAPGPDGIPCGAYRCAGGLGSKFLFDAYKAVVGRRCYS